MIFSFLYLCLFANEITDGKGKISHRDLKRVAHELGETMSDAELLEMIERADTDNDGEINFEEFYSIMVKKQFA